VHYFSGFNPTETKIIGYWESVVGATFHDRRVIPLRQRGIPANYGIPYTKPVIVLIGGAVASSNETFVAYMMHLTNITTMGETSWGTAAGNNRSHDLVNGLSMRIPMMTLLDINQNHIEDVGISPNIQVSFINDGSDNVLIRAFAHLGVTVTDSTLAPVAPTITTTSFPNGTVGAPYSQTLNATGTAPIIWSIDSGTLPAGLNLSGSTISGTPTTAGTSTFTVRAANGIAPDGTKQLSITVNTAGNGDADSSSGGGGCNAIWGLFEFLPLAVWVVRKRLAV
jgi:hypothetical protein